MTVLVVTGVRREAQIAAGPGIATLCSGGSPARLRTLLAAHDPHGLTAVVSFGIGGGLDPALRPGDLVAADAVVTSEVRWPTDAVLSDALIQALPDTGRRAPILGVDRALVDPAEKGRARQQTDAALVDMESHIAAAYAARHGLPFAALRLVCDPADHALPPLVAEALNEDGSVSLTGVVGSLLRQPGQIGDLIRLAKTSRIAFAALGKAGAALRILANP